MLVATWITLHLVLAMWEIFHKPILPWDAWLTWMYKAKAWALNGTLMPMISPFAWLHTENTTLYNVAAAHYPPMVPVVAFWAATTLGHWSETLISGPVILCGIAIVLGVYGQCRDYGMSFTLAIVSSYLFISVPLVGTHLALPGQADIWMAGFAGLGFIALIRGIIEKSNYQILVGLTLIALSCIVKQEGTVWLLMAIVLIAASLHYKAIVLFCIALIPAIYVSLLLLGQTYIEIPGAGALGTKDGHLLLPFFGEVVLRDYHLLDDYIDDFFLKATWHLLPLFLLLALGLLGIKKRATHNAPAMIFLVLLVLTQAFIFAFTEQGQWAEDGTAINRLPLHFVPTFVFCVMLSVYSTLSSAKANSVALNDPKLNHRKSIFLIPALAFAIVVASLIAYLGMNNPHPQGQPRTFTPDVLRFVMGGGSHENDEVIVEQYSNNVAILSSGTVSIDARKLSVANLQMQRKNDQQVAFFWRRAGDGENVDSVEIPRAGHFLHLSQLEAWRGTITEVGLIIFKSEPGQLTLNRITLSPRSISSDLASLAHQWGQYESWTQASAHWTAGGDRNPLVPLPLLVSSWVLLVLLIYVIQRRSLMAALAPFYVCALLGWVALDVRWTVNGVKQAIETRDNYASRATNEPVYLDMGNDKAIAKLVAGAKTHFAHPNATVLITAIDPKMRFQVLRAKYHMLPYKAYAHDRPIEDFSNVDKVEYVLALRPLFLDQGQEARDAKSLARDLESTLNTTLTILMSSETGILLTRDDSKH